MFCGGMPAIFPWNIIHAPRVPVKTQNENFCDFFTIFRPLRKEAPAGLKSFAGIPFYTSSRTKPKVLHVIPKRRTSREGPPRLLQSFAMGFLVAEERLCSLTSPLWGSCAASSKYSCKQTFLLASDGMTESSPCYNHAARKVAPLRSIVEFDNPSVRRLRVVHLPLHRGGKRKG